MQLLFKFFNFREGKSHCFGNLLRIQTELHKVFGNLLDALFKAFLPELFSYRHNLVLTYRFQSLDGLQKLRLVRDFASLNNIRNYCINITRLALRFELKSSNPSYTIHPLIIKQLFCLKQPLWG